jgi:hypothetical protein
VFFNRFCHFFFSPENQIKIGKFFFVYFSVSCQLIWLIFKKEKKTKSSIFLISKLTSMEIGAAETGREGGKWEKKQQQRRTREREGVEKDSFVRLGDETVIFLWYHPYTPPFIHPTKQVRQSERFGRPLARARARSLLSLSLSRLVRTALLVALACACRPWHQKALQQSVMKR